MYNHEEKRTLSLLFCIGYSHVKGNKDTTWPGQGLGKLMISSSSHIEHHNSTRMDSIRNKAVFEYESAGTTCNQKLALLSDIDTAIQDVSSLAQDVV